MSDNLVNLRDIQFVLYEMLGVEALTKYDYFAEHSRETFDTVLDAAYRLAREVCWPAYVEMDRIGATYDAKTKTTRVPEAMHRVWQAYKEGGWHGATAAFDLGGQQLPGVVNAATSLMFNAANTAANMYVGGAVGGAGLIQSFGSEELKQTYLEKLYGGEWGATMCLTEPQAGSSLSDVKTTAVPAKGGDYYLLTGTKCFISSGDHDLTENIVHPVLARLPDAPPGVKGISLFIVPKYRVNADGSVGEFNDVVTAGIEHKLGLKGNATATLSFGDAGDCRGWLLGEPNRGLAYMFQLMNHARISTGLQATSLAANAYQHALQYARERLQGRIISEKNPLTPQVPIIKHADVRRMLLAQKAITEGMFALLAYAALLGDKEQCGAEGEKMAARDILDVLTPVCKAYGSEASYDSIVLAIQCYGGYGFIEEFPLAQMLRDCKVFPIYEGTNGIQAMDLLGRKVVMKNGEPFRAVLAEISRTVDGASGVPALKEMADKVGAAMNEVGETTMQLGGMAMAGDIEGYMSGAVGYLQMFSRLVLSWLFLWQATVAQKALDAGAGPADQSYYQGKLATAHFYLNNELPHLHATAAILKSGERTALDFNEEWF